MLLPHIMLLKKPETSLELVSLPHFLCFIFFFLLWKFTIHRTAGEGGGYFFKSSTTSTHFIGTQTLAGWLPQRAHLCIQLAAGLHWEPLVSECKLLTTKLHTVCVVHDIWRKIFVLLFSINCSIFIIWLPLLQVLGNMCIEIVF